MNIKASYECFLTQNKDVPLRERLFLEQVSISSLDEVQLWKQVTKEEKKAIEDKEAFFSVDNVDINYLHKMNDVMVKVSYKINKAELTNDEALEMKKYYPNWDSIIGERVEKGFKFVCDDILFEVVEPHVVSADRKPTMQVMTLSLNEDIPQPIYYQKVLSSQEEAEINAKKEKEEKNIKNHKI